MTTTTHLSNDPQYADVGMHSTQGAIQAAKDAVNASITETVKASVMIEDEGRRELAKEETAQREATAAENDPMARMQNAGKGEAVIGTGRGQTIDLSADTGVGELNRAVEGQAKDIDQQAKDMSKTPGVYRHAPTNGVSNLDDRTGGFKMAGTGSLTGTKIETTGFSLKGGEDEFSASIKPKGGGVVESGKNFSVFGNNGPAQAPALNGPRLAAAPAGPGGMGGGARSATLRTQASSVNVSAPQRYIGQIMREESARGNAPSHMTRAEWDAQKNNIQPEENSMQTAYTPVRTAASAMNPMFTMNPTFEPKGPTWNGGEKMGSGEEGNL